MKVLNELNNVYASEELILETLKLCKDRRLNTESKKVVNIRKKAVVLLMAGTLIVLSAGGVLAAYNVIRNNGMFRTNNTAQSMNHMEGITDENGNTYKSDSINEINATVEDKNLSVSFVSFVSNKHEAIFTIDVRTTDGSAINEMSENKVATIARDTFDDVKIKLNGKEVGLHGITYMANNEPNGANCYTQRVDDGSDITYAKFELTFSDYDEDISASLLNISLSNYSSDYTVYRNNDFLYQNVDEMFTGIKLADDSQFTGKNPAGYVNSPVELAAGNMHIKFSSTFPDSYIDNAGYTTKEYGGKKVFVMTIVPGSAEMTELEKLTFQNMTSGHSELMGRRVLEDGRLQLTYSCNMDRVYSETNSGIYKDTSNEYLKNLALRIIDKEASTREVISSGTWEYEVQLQDNSDEKTTEINNTVDIRVNDTYYSGMYINIDEFKLTNTTLSLSGSADIATMQGVGRHLMSGSNSYSPVIIMKNGTTFNAGNKCSAGGNTNTGDQDYSWILPSVINVNDVATVSWHGTVIYQSK